MSYKIEALPNSYAELGEGPHWDIPRQSLYYVDINGAKIYRYDYQQNKVYKAQIEGEEYAGFIVPIDGTTDKFAVGCGRRIVSVTWDGVSTTSKVDRVLYDIEKDGKFAGNRINDGKCDPRGRLFAGTMFADFTQRLRTGVFYRFDKSGKTNVIKTDIACSNGLTWNEKNNKFYYIDTLDYEVKAYDYDFETGTPSNPRVVYNLKDSQTFPDGMTIDSEGYLYVATFNDQSVHKVDPRTGKLLQRIELPCKQITSVAFGGPNLDILFVTSASMGGEPAPAGTTFKITGLAVKGLPMTNLKL